MSTRAALDFFILDQIKANFISSSKSKAHKSIMVTSSSTPAPIAAIEKLKAVATTSVELKPSSRRRFSWEVGPMKLIATPSYTTQNHDSFTQCATKMALVHNAIIRSFNSIYLQAPNLKLAEYKDFIGYAHAWYIAIHAHHDGEEDFLFPEIEKSLDDPGCMSNNIKQHEAFHDGLEEFGSYTKSLLHDAKSFNTKKLISIMDSFYEPLNQHLHDEIPTLLDLAKHPNVPKLDLPKLMSEEAKQAMGSLSQTGPLPLFFLNLDKTYEGGMHSSFPEDVPVVAKWLMCNVFSWVNAGWWKFATCDKAGRLKELHSA